MIPGLHRSVWVILLGASLLLSLAMGMRQSMGLFLPPVTKAFGLAAAEFTLAVAVQNMVWGLSQPLLVRWQIALVCDRSCSQAVCSMR